MAVVAYSHLSSIMVKETEDKQCQFTDIENCLLCGIEVPVIKRTGETICDQCSWKIRSGRFRLETEH